MKLPKQEDFAILLMAELATQKGRRVVPISSIAKRHGVSQLFLKKIVRSLRKAGLVESKEGLHGGYALAAHPARISVWDVIQAFTPKPHGLSSLAGGNCPLFSACLPQHIHRVVTVSLEKGLREIYLNNLLETTEDSQKL